MKKEMKKYKIVLIYSDGLREEQDKVFGTEYDAIEYAYYLIGYSREGYENPNLSDTLEYSFADCKEPDYEIIEADN